MDSSHPLFTNYFSIPGFKYCGTGTFYNPTTKMCEATPPPPAITCGTGTYQSGNTCVANITTCGSGTTQSGTTCNAVITGCGTATSNVNGICEANITTCGSGTTQSGTTCNANIATCGTNTYLNGNVCDVNGTATCNEFTVFDTANVTCDALITGCGEGAVYDSTQQACVSIESTCADATPYYDSYSLVCVGNCSTDVTVFPDTANTATDPAYGKSCVFTYVTP